MSSETSGPEPVVGYVVEDHIARVTLNRPELLNAMNMAMIHALIEVFDRISDDPDVRCVILEGAGRAFCVGADHNERPNLSIEQMRYRRRIAPRAFGAARQCIRPVIAKVQGYALGGGLELALGCDMVMVAEDAVLGLVESTLASIPGGGGTQILPRLVGPMKAKELILTGRKFTGAEAAAMGMVNHAVPSSELEERTMDLAHEITATGPLANVQSKRAIDLSSELDIENGMKVEAALIDRILTSSDRAEAIAARQEGRPPRFRGE